MMTEPSSGKGGGVTSRHAFMATLRELFPLRSLTLVAIGVLLNLGLAFLVSVLQLPLFLDSLGTVVTAAVGGYLPGVAVGYLTNLFNSASNLENIYYGVLNVLIGVLAGWFAKKKYFSRFPHVLLTVLAFASVGGLLGSVLTWFMYGGFGEGISAPLANALYPNVIPDMFLAQLCADFGIDLADKVVTVLLTVVILRLLPKSVVGKYDGDARRNESAREKKAGHHWYLSRKVIALLAACMTMILIGISAIGIRQYRAATLEDNALFVQDTARLIASQIDAERVDDYLEKGEQAEGYAETKERLQKIMDSTTNIEFIYVYQIRPDGCHVVFDLDTPEVEGGKPGEVIPFDGAFEGLLPELLAGQMIEPMISDDTFGWLMTAYYPVYDKAGVCKCYGCADIAMPKLAVNENTFIAKILSLFGGLFVLLLTLSIHLARHEIIQPINAMAAAAGDFAYNDEEAREETVDRIRDLRIHTGDEIENLYHAMVRTTEDTAAYIKDSQEKNATITRLQDNLINVMAELVESRDVNTGDHIRKTAGYVAIIIRRLREKGLYADQVTDQFTSDVVRSAALHDIGKIRIPDRILNKPGRLSQEEFDQMKLHTVYGREVIDHVMAAMPEKETAYLKEAGNMIVGHHEKWDGSGYPNGLKGAEIPLSARIMAVADVFDALVSKRAYKDPYSVEKAMEIIREGKGKHFDPLVAQAFLDCEDEIRALAVENAMRSREKSRVQPDRRTDRNRER